MRELALALLDDDHGINATAWSMLRDLLIDDEQNDIIDAIKCQDNRVYIPENTL